MEGTLKDFNPLSCLLFIFCGEVFSQGPKSIDDKAKDGGLGEVLLLCSFYHEPLHSLIVKEVK